MNKKIFKFSLVVALMAGIVALYSCDKDELTPGQDGRNLANELCDCFTGAGDDDTKKLACISDFESKANKWKGDDREALQVAFDEAITTCGTSPYNWYYTHLATVAATEFCALAAQYPDGGNMMILAPLYMEYETELNSENPAFLNPFFATLMACSPTSDWILCTFGMTDFCPEDELTDEQLTALAAEAAPEFCQYFTENPTADMTSMLASGVAKYSNYFSKPVFIGALLQGLGSCSSTPQWFICMMTGNTAPGCN